MDLIGMVNGLERMDNEQPFSAAAYKLAGKIIALCNSLYWKTEISVDLNKLACMASCSSTHTALKARNELVDRRVLVIIEEGRKGKPTRYGLVDLSGFPAKNARNSPQYSEGFPAKNARINKQYSKEERYETFL